MVSKRKGILGCSCRLCYMLVKIEGREHIKVLVGKRNILMSRHDVNVHIAQNEAHLKHFAVHDLHPASFSHKCSRSGSLFSMSVQRLYFTDSLTLRRPSYLL